MKKWIIATVLVTFVTTAHPQEMGNATTESAKVAASNNWKNWVFAGGAIAAAALCITLVALNTGSSPQHN